MGLFQVAPGAKLNGFFCAVRITGSGHNDDFWIGGYFKKMGQGIQAVTVGELHIKENEFKEAVARLLHAELQRISGLDAVSGALEMAGKHLGQHGIIIDY